MMLFNMVIQIAFVSEFFVTFLAVVFFTCVNSLMGLQVVLSVESLATKRTTEKFIVIIGVNYFMFP